MNTDFLNHLDTLLGPLLVLNLGVTAAMTGLIWFVQVVHYPLMAQIGPQHYSTYQRAHMSRTSWVVGPLMIIEVVTALALVFALRDQNSLALAWRALSLLALIWISTACLQVPAHNRLLEGFDPKAHQRLVVSNWVRTLAWTGRVLLVGMLNYVYFAHPATGA